MRTRRDFIRNSLLTAGALSFAQLKGEYLPALPEHSDDTESYWKLVRAQFPLSNSRIYLNNGTMGPSPYSVLNEVQQEMLEIETSGRYGGYEDVAIKSLS